jgi:hypothetical protein
MGTTSLAIGGSLLYPLADLIGQWGKNGWKLQALRQHWKERIKSGVLIAVVWWFALLSYQLFAVARQIRLDARRVHVPHLKAPTPPGFAYIKTERNAESPSQARIIQVEPPYGNLAERCDSLGRSIINFANGRLSERPPMDEAHRGQYMQWYSTNDGLFRFRVQEDIGKIYQELSELHIRDARLNDLLKRGQETYAYRNESELTMKNCTEHADFPPCHLSVDEIKETGERLVFLATQVPKH